MLSTAFSTTRLGLALGDEQVGLALVRQRPDGQEVLESSLFPELTRDGNRLLEQIDHFLNTCHGEISQLDGIALCAGPGGFTRVRVACAVAQGMGLAHGISVAPVNSMLAQALATWQMRQPATGTARGGFRPMQVCVLLDARMKELYAATYQFAAAEGLRRRPTLEVLREPGLLALDDLPEYFESMRVSNRPAPDADLAPIRRISGNGAVRYLAPGSAALSSANNWLGQQGGSVDEPAACELAVAALRTAQPADWLTASQVTPFYLREKVALNIAEQAALRAANRRDRQAR